MPKICNFVECEESIPSRHHLCRPHWEQEQDDEIDECGNCGHHKPAQYELCLTCKREQSRSKRKSTRTKTKAKVAESTPEYMVGAPDPRPRKDAETDVFYVYLLYLNDGSYYPGHTNDLGTRNLEHLIGKTKSTRGKDPKLAWFSMVHTRVEAKEYERVLKELCDNNERAITRMIYKFLELIEDVHNPRKTSVT